MEFVRKRKAGCSQKTFRVWHSDDDGDYRITWRSEVMGVRVRPGYHATVLSTNRLGHEFWSFCTARRPFKTFELAVEACEKNQRLWEAFCKIAETERKGRADRVRALDAKAKIGSGAAAHKVMSVLPVWVGAKAEPFLIRLLFPVGRRLAEDGDDECESSNDQSNLTSPSPSFDGSPPTGLSDDNGASEKTSGPASDAKATAEQPSRRRRAKPGTGTRAKPAKGPAKARKKPATKRTGKPFKSTA
jgi:hypothetical protein